MPTKIEWCRNPDGTPGETWNPIAGCSPESAGCKNCYAQRLAATRLQHHPLYAGLTKNGRWTGEVNLSESKLGQLEKWRKPRGIFVCDMSDLGGAPGRYVRRILGAMAGADRHTYMLLTKRPARLRSMLRVWVGRELPRNWWVGVSVEDQDSTDRIEDLLRIDAAVRFVSYEPALGPIDIGWSMPVNAPRGADGERLGVGLQWVIAGAETGPRKRPADLGWFRSVRDQCAAADVPFFFKKDSEGNDTLDGVLHRGFPGGVKC